MQVHRIAYDLLQEMGGDAHHICSGYCTVFAKRLIDRIGKGEIVSNLSREMLPEIAGYPVIEPEIHFGSPDRNSDVSHCWVKVDDKFYDAFNTEGVEEEHELQFYIDNVF